KRGLAILFSAVLVLSVGAAYAQRCRPFATTGLDSVIVNFSDTVAPADVDRIRQQYHLNLALNSPSDYARNEQLYEFHYNAKKLGNVSRLMSRLTADAAIEYAEPNYIYKAFFSPNDDRYNEQWNLRAIDMPQAWDLTQGEGATVAVIDTGVTRVPDLAKTQFVRGYDFVDNDDRPEDLHGHGTHVAGTVAQSTDNMLGVAGVAYKANIMPIRVLGANGSGTVADIAEGIRFAADNGATVINMSLGGGGSSQLMQEAVQYAVRKNVTVIAAAGNSNANGSGYPARYPEVISVSATGPTGDKAPYSNYGTGVDISAPGGAKTESHPEWGVLQQTVERRNPSQPSFEYFQGTSMASPHVAGVAALIQSQDVTDPNRVRTILKKSATPVNDDKLNYYGAGRLNAYQAVARANSTAELGLWDALKLWLDDFLRYLNSNGYLNPRFWFDGGAVMLVPKLIMVFGGYLVLLIVRWWLSPRGLLRWSFPLTVGLVLGSSGLMVLRGLHVIGLPHWPMQLAGSSLPELGSAFAQSDALNPLTASILIPFALVALFLGHRTLGWAAIGLCCGMAAHLLFAGTVAFDGVLWIGTGWWGRGYLLANGLACLLLAYLASRAITESASTSSTLATK
ncbi:MAG: DUF5942 domain-containing protein, partial [Cyanobacteria bacterium P01_D01_bin.123]